MNISTPVIFTDGSDFYEALSNEYERHNKGLFILAPSGAGKTFFVKSQTTQDWIDGDDLWPAAGADTTSDDWPDDGQLVEETNRRCDVVTNEARKLGFWVIGSSNDSLRPDAIVLPEWPVHQQYIKSREVKGYDGGAKMKDLDGVLEHREVIKRWSAKGVPEFGSIIEAVDHFAILNQ